MIKLVKLQDKFILVSNEIAGYTYNKPTWNSDNRIGLSENNQSKKIIAGIKDLPSIDFSLLSEEDCKKIGWVDVEKLCPCIGNDFRFEWISGFKIAQFLNDKLFRMNIMNAQNGLR